MALWASLCWKCCPSHPHSFVQIGKVLQGWFKSLPVLDRPGFLGGPIRGDLTLVEFLQGWISSPAGICSSRHPVRNAQPEAPGEAAPGYLLRERLGLLAPAHPAFPSPRAASLALGDFLTANSSGSQLGLGADSQLQVLDPGLL